MPQPPDVALAHYSDRQSLVTAGAEVAGQMWAEVNPDRIVESWTAQVPELTAVLSGAQFGAARQADPYLDEVAAWQELDPATASPIDPRAFAGTASDGRGLMSLLMSPAFSALQVIASGLGSMQGLSLGRQHLDTIARTQVADAGRLADGVALAARRGIDGYVRVVVGKTCSRCIALAGRHYRWSAGFKRHPHCDCIHLPSSVARSGRLIQNPHRLYESMSAKERQRAGWSLADQKAIADGADLAQVTNAHRGVYEAGGRRYTHEGTTKRGFAGSRLGKRARMTPEQIYAEAADRDEALRLLYDHGYLVNEPAVMARESLSLAAAPPRPAAVGEDAARARQAEIDAARKVADPAARLLGLIGHEAEPDVIRHQLDTFARRYGVDTSHLVPLADDRLALARAVEDMTTRAGLTRIGAPGERSALNRSKHELIADAPTDGQVVEVIRPGYMATLRSGEEVRLSKATVEAVNPEWPHGSVMPPGWTERTGTAKRAATRARQAEIDRRGKVADLLAELDSLVAKKADAAIFRQRLAMAASDGVDPKILAKLAGPIESGNMTALRGTITRTGKAEGLTPIGKAGDKVKFDEALHDPLGDMPAAGAQVVVVRRGTVLDLNGERITLERAQTSLVGVPAKKTATKKAGTAAGGDLSKMTVAQLRELAKERGVAIPSKALKADIVKLLDGAKTPAKKAATAVKKVATKPEDLTVAELRALAKQHGVTVPSGLSKADIIAHLRLQEGGRTPILPGTAERRAAAVAARAAKDKALADDWKRWDAGRHVDIHPGNLPAIDPANPLAAYGNRLTIEDRGDTAHTHLADLETMPLRAHGRLQEHFADLPRSGFYVGARAVPELDELSHLRGVQPRGWDPGDTWDIVPGAYGGTVRRCALGGGTGTGHGAESLALHEAGHALDHAMDLVSRASGTAEWRSLADDFIAAVGEAKVHPYFTPGGNPDGYLQEMWAEGFAAWNVYRSAPNVAERVGLAIAGRTTFADARTFGRTLVDYFERLDQRGWSA